jgi:hypothetical protein
MRSVRWLAASVLLVSCVATFAKDKKKKTPLPADILKAQTAWVIVDPEAGVDPEDPNGNQHAREAVENALAKWGRLNPVAGPTQADLIIVIRKGTGQLVSPTIGGTPMNTPPTMIGQRTDDGMNGSVRTGPMGRTSDPIHRWRPAPRTIPSRCTGGIPAMTTPPTLTLCRRLQYGDTRGRMLLQGPRSVRSSSSAGRSPRRRR